MAVSSSESASSAPATVKVFVWSQFDGVNCRVAGLTVTLGSGVAPSVARTVTGPAGSDASLTVISPSAPSPNASARGSTTSASLSSSNTASAKLSVTAP